MLYNVVLVSAVQRSESAMHVRSVVTDSATPWIVVPQAPLSMGFSRQDTGVGCHFLLQGIFLTQGLNLPFPCLTAVGK